MDPVALIVTALAEGTALELQDTSATAVQDAYASLWARVRKRLAGRPEGATVLARHAEAPQTWEVPLSVALTAAGAACDTDLIAAATNLLRLADEPGFRSGKYAVDSPGPQAAQITDHSVTDHSVADHSVTDHSITDRSVPGQSATDHGVSGPHNSLNGQSGH